MMGGGLGDIGAGLGSMIGGGAVLLGAGGKGGDEYYRKAIEVWEKLQDPDYDWREIPPAELRIFAQYFPEQYTAVLPPEARQIIESPELKLSQLRSLKRLEDMSTGGLPLEEELAGQEAGRRIATEAGRAQDAAIRDVSARGRLGTAGELSARMQGNQQLSELERALGSDLAQKGIEARRYGLEGASGLAGQIRGQDFQAEAANADIMNELARYISEQKTQEAAANAAARQAAAWENADLSQRIGESNELNRRGAAVENLERKNALKSALSAFQLQKTRGLSNAYTGRGTQKDQDKAARERTIMELGQGAGRAGGGIASMFAFGG